MSDLEDRAAAAAAFVLGATAVCRDSPGAPSGTRDFDLVFADGSLEPVEITRHASQDALGTWSRQRRRIAPALTRVWTLNVPNTGSGGRGPYDARECLSKVDSALKSLEDAGCFTLAWGKLSRDATLREAFDLLLELRVTDGMSRAPTESESPAITLMSVVGGFTHGDLIAWGIEQEAMKSDNQAKLAQPSDANRRHLVVVFDVSSGSAYNAAEHAEPGRAPVLPAPITTAWAMVGPRVLLITPPEAWEEHSLPLEVFSNPERWIDQT